MHSAKLTFPLLTAVQAAVILRMPLCAPLGAQANAPTTTLAQPRVRISGDAESGPLVGRMRSATLRADGGVVIADDAEDQLHWFDRTGRFERSVGRDGSNRRLSPSAEKRRSAHLWLRCERKSGGRQLCGHWSDRAARWHRSLPSNRRGAAVGQRPTIAAGDDARRQNARDRGSTSGRVRQRTVCHRHIGSIRHAIAHHSRRCARP